MKVVDPVGQNGDGRDNDENMKDKGLPVKSPHLVRRRKSAHALWSVRLRFRGFVRKEVLVICRKQARYSSNYLDMLGRIVEWGQLG